MKRVFLFLAIVLEDAAWWLRDRARTPDLVMPFYPEDRK